MVYNWLIFDIYIEVYIFNINYRRSLIFHPRMIKVALFFGKRKILTQKE